MDKQARHGPSPTPSPASGFPHRRLGSQPHADLNQASPSSASPAHPTDAATLGLGLGLDLEHQQQASQPFPAVVDSDFSPLDVATDFIGHQQSAHQPYAPSNLSDPLAFDQNPGFGPPPLSGTSSDPSMSFNSHQAQSTAYLSPNLADGDFSLFPASGGPGDQFNPPLFEQQNFSPSDLNAMTPSHSHHSPTPPTLLQPDGLLPASSQHSPSFSQHPFPASPSHHSRNASLGPEAALLPGQLADWNQPQFQGHRRSPSEYSDVSSVSPSPHLVSSDSFDDHTGHSPLQASSDGGYYQDVLDIGTFTIADSHNPNQVSSARSPSLSPAISPRINSQQTPDLQQPTLSLMPPNGVYGAPAYSGLIPAKDAPFSSQSPGAADISQMTPPAINIDFAPNNVKPGPYESSKSAMDQDSLTPPDRGRLKSRPRSVTDPFRPGGAPLSRPGPLDNLSLSISSDGSSRSESSRSLSPLDRQSTSSSRGRRQSTSAVPNNAIALRLADPEYQSSQDAGTTKRIQKHPATFSCSLCPKKFTRAYNLRSHLRTHTDERPFVCTVCGKAFARQHDRKRHESLHSGEKKFVCKGDLKVGGQWGCGRRFARADALGRHFRSEAGRICIKPLLDEEMIERQRLWQEQRDMAHSMAAPQSMMMDTGPECPPDLGGNNILPTVLLVRYPALAQMSWSGVDTGAGLDDELSGRSSFDASDYDEGDDGGYASGPSTGYGEGAIAQHMSELGGQ